MRISLGTVTAGAIMLFATAAMAATVTYSTTLPSLAFSAPGYTANGSITANVVDVPGCTAGVYIVNATPVAGSGPAASTPPTTTTTAYIGFPQGSRLFANAGYGSYTITTTTTSCGVGVAPAPTIDVVTLAAPAGIATMSEWALIFFGLMLAAGAALFIQRRQMTV